jgi:hypothetical protein
MKYAIEMGSGAMVLQRVDLLVGCRLLKNGDTRLLLGDIFAGSRVPAETIEYNSELYLYEGNVGKRVVN